MHLYQIILSAVIPIFLLMATGFVMHRAGWMDQNIDASVMRLALNLFVPCLIIDVVIGNPALKEVSVVFWGIGIGFSIVVVGYLVAHGVALIFGLKQGEGRRTFSIVTAIQNYGFLPLPIIATLFPDDSGNCLFAADT